MILSAYRMGKCAGHLAALGATASDVGSFASQNPVTALLAASLPAAAAGSSWLGTAAGQGMAGEYGAPEASKTRRRNALISGGVGSGLLLSLLLSRYMQHLNPQ